MWPLVHFGSAAVSLYGVLVVLGYTAGIFWCLANVKNAKGTTGEFWALGYTLVFGALAGARLGFYLVEFDGVLEDPAFLAHNWRTGWVFWTGFLGSMATGKLFQLAYNRLYRPRRYLQIADYFAPALALGHTLGRIGCFAEGCCHGAATRFSLAVVFTSSASSVDPAWLGVPLHPVQLYEALGSFLLFLFFAYKVMPAIRAKKLAYGTSFLGYICLYAVMRFVLEFLRGDDRGGFLSPILSPSQWLSAGAFLAAGGRLYYQGIREGNPARTVYLDSEPSSKSS